MISSIRALPIVLAFYLIFVAYTAQAQHVYLLNDPSVPHRLDAYTEIFVDSANKVSIEDVTQSDFQHRFRVAKTNLTFGYLKYPLWLKIKTQTTRSHERWYLEIPAPFLEYVDFYQLKDGTWQHAQSGYYRAQSVRTFSHTTHVLPLEFDHDAISTLYIKISGNSPKTFPIFIMEEQVFEENVRLNDLVHGVFFGILIVMFFYNFFIYLTLKQPNYLLYICTIVFTFLIFSSASGYAGKFLWPETPVMNYYAGRLSLGLFAIVLTLFTIRFLNVRQYSRTMYYVLLSLIALGVVAFILVATGTLYSAGNNLIGLCTVTFMTAGVVCRIRGNKAANYFIAAWTIYFTGGLLLTLRNNGVLDYNFWTTHFVQIGAALETIIIAFALGDQYRRLRIEKEDAQAFALKLQHEATVELGMKVSERTEQLSKANEELRVALETNKQQTKIIENKNAELDAFFYRISHDLKGPISSLQGLSWLAMMEITDPLSRSYFDKQHQQIERLNHIVTGLINLIMLSHTELHREKIDAVRLVDECIASLNGQPNFNKITFRKEIQPDIEFYSEWTLLNTILQNLVENAIKYARNDSPFVRVKFFQVEKGVILEVEDNGHGIPKEHQSKIFEMFYRASHNVNGTGLGLYILKRSLDKLNGKIDIKSEVGIGSTFSVTLPAENNV
jgi:signal transduction histidine kinase